jgi:hypothetical protein
MPILPSPLTPHDRLVSPAEYESKMGVADIVTFRDAADILKRRCADRGGGMVLGPVLQKLVSLTKFDKAGETNRRKTSTGVLSPKTKVGGRGVIGLVPGSHVAATATANATATAAANATIAANAANAAAAAGVMPADNNTGRWTSTTGLASDKLDLRRQGEVGVADFILLCIDLFEATIATSISRRPLLQTKSISVLTIHLLKKYRRGGVTTCTQYTAFSPVAITRVAMHFLAGLELRRCQAEAAEAIATTLQVAK